MRSFVRFIRCGRRALIQKNNAYRHLSTAAKNIDDIELPRRTYCKNGSLFPWRASENKNISELSFKTRLHKLILDDVFGSRDFLHGSKRIFECSLAAIFLSSHLKNTQLHQISLGYVDGSYHMPITDVFSEDLAKFYSDAVIHMGRQNLFSLHYDLQTISVPKVVSRDILMLSSENKDKHDLLQRIDFFGVGFLVPKKNAEGTASVKLADTILMRTEVEFECEGDELCSSLFVLD